MPNVAVTSQRAAEKISIPGRYPCGASLYLQVGKANTKSWLFRYTINGRQREMGLGAMPAVDLAAARRGTIAARHKLASGIDPLADGGATPPAETLTFEALAEAHIEAQAPGWRSPKSADQWRASLATYAFPSIGRKLPAEIGVEEVAAVLRPIWTTKPETARRVRQRIEAVLAVATVRGLRSGANPATLANNVALLLPRQKKAVVHRPALPWRSAPAVVGRLLKANGTAAKVAAFVAMTAVRPSEAAGMRWREISGSTWTIPGDRTKTSKPHRVPLSPEATALLGQRPDDPAAFVFPGPRGEALTTAAILKALRLAAAPADVTTHGLRSTFRDWCGENRIDRDLAELSLGHALGDDVERAYARSDLLEQRRPVMKAWGAWCATGKASKRASKK